MKGELCNAVVVVLGTTTRSGIMEWSQNFTLQICYELSNECIWGKNYRYPVHRHKSLDFFVFVASALRIGIDFIAPILAERSACSYVTYGFLNRFIEDMRALAVSVVVHGSVTADIKRCAFRPRRWQKKFYSVPSVRRISEQENSSRLMLKCVR